MRCVWRKMRPGAFKLKHCESICPLFPERSCQMQIDMHVHSVCSCPLLADKPIPWIASFTPIMKTWNRPNKAPSSSMLEERKSLPEELCELDSCKLLLTHAGPSFCTGWRLVLLLWLSRRQCIGKGLPGSPLMLSAQHPHHQQ